MDIEKIVKEFIEKHFLYRKDEKTVSKDESLLSSGLIDSTGIFELVSFLEKEFNIEVSDEEIVPENFETINNIVEFVSVSAKRNKE
ncbi:MAG: acyl carrier protein [Thermodesulfobacteriota bacterium]